MWGTVLHAEWDPRPTTRVTADERAARHARVASDVWRHAEVRGETVADPVPGHGEVVVRVRRCGVCGSDTHCVEHDADGYVKFSGPAQFPCVLGHEYSGEVVAVGPGVRQLRVGALVAAEGMVYCGVCEACRRGRLNQCSRLRMVGFSAPGAYADYVCAREANLWDLTELSDAVGPEKALTLGATVEPIACAYNGLWTSAGGFSPGSHVAVYGCGPIGLGAILLARAAGAAKILAFDVVPERVALALACGADAAYDTRNSTEGSPSDIIMEQTRGWGADVQIEAAGAARHTLPEVARAFAPGGTLVYLGRSGEVAPVELDRLVSGAARIVGSRGHAGGGCFPNLLRLMAAGRLDATPMITAELPLEHAVAALTRSTRRTDGKIMLVRD